MRTKKALRLAVALVLVLALSLTLISCKRDDPQPSPSQSVKPSETTKPTESAKPSETTTPTEEPTPSETAGLLDDEFWDWYGGSGNTLDYDKLSDGLKDGQTYNVKPINETGDVTIENDTFNGTVIFSDINVGGTLTINMPNATVKFNKPATVNTLYVTSGAHTFVLNALLTANVVVINGGNVEINAKVVATTDEQPVVEIASGASTEKVTINAPVNVDNKKDGVEIIVNKANDVVNIKASANTIIDARVANNKENVKVSGGDNISEKVNAPVSGEGESNITIVDGTPTQIKIVEVATAEEFKTALTSAGEIRLTNEITFEEEIIIAKTLVLDLNGHNIAFESQKSFRLNNADSDLTITGKGKIYEKAPYFAPVLIKATPTGAAKLVVGKDVTLEGWSGVMIDQTNGQSVYNADVTVNGTLNGVKDIGGDHGSAIYVNGQIKEGSVKVTINPTAKLIADGTVIYAAGYANWTINDGVYMEGTLTGIEIRAGEMTINGGTIIAKGDPTTVDPNGNGTTTVGAALAVAQHTTKLTTKLTVNGGTFTGASALSVANPQGNAAEDFAKVSVALNGGMYNGKFNVGGDISAATVTKGENVTLAAPNGYVWKDGTTLSSYITANGTSYETLKEAFDAITNVETAVIEINGDVDLSADAWMFDMQSYTTLKTLTINGNGNTISGLKVNKAATENPTGGAQAGSSNYYGTGFIGRVASSQTLNINGLTFKNAQISDSGNAFDTTENHSSGVAVVVGISYGKTNLNNVNVEGGTVLGGEKVGALIGFSMGDEDVITGGSVKNVTISCKYYYSAQVVGFENGKLKITDIAISGNTNRLENKYGLVSGENENGIYIYDPIYTLWIMVAPSASSNPLTMRGGTDAETITIGEITAQSNGHLIEATESNGLYSLTYPAA